MCKKQRADTVKRHEKNRGVLTGQRKNLVQTLVSEDCRRESVPQKQSFMTFQDTVSLREQVCVSSTKEIPSWIHNPPSPGLNDYPSATAQTDSPIPNLKQKSTHSKFVQCISEKRCSQTPLPAPHAFGIVTNSVTA